MALFDTRVERHTVGFALVVEEHPYNVAVVDRIIWAHSA